MIDHSGISVAHIGKAIAFYDQALAALGFSMLAEVPKEYTDGKRVVGYGAQRPQFWLSEGETQKPPLHFAFSASNRAAVDAFYEAALNAGGSDNGAPGPRPHYHENYYGAFVLDPEGNNIEAVCHKAETE
jgi:catechol 2,3-dioxygenase-like lactoylglutathione lyase family enzyme